MSYTFDYYKNEYGEVCIDTSQLHDKAMRLAETLKAEKKSDPKGYAENLKSLHDYNYISPHFMVHRLIREMSFIFEKLKYNEEDREIREFYLAKLRGE